MSNLDDRIAALEAEIDGYKSELKNAITPEEKSELRKLIIARGETLNRLLDERRILSQSQAAPQADSLFNQNVILGKIEEMSVKMDKELKATQKAVYKANLRNMKKELDCWNSNARTKVESEEFKDSLVNFYNRSDPNIQNNVICMITNFSFPRHLVRASHIIKKCTDGETMSYFCLTPNIDDPKNGLLLIQPIEQLFDRKDLCFLYDPNSSQLKAKLLKVSLSNYEMESDSRSKYINPNTGNPMKYGDIDGLVLQLPIGVFPYRRILSFHAKLAFSRALSRGWILNTNNEFETYFNVSDGGIDEPLGMGDFTWQEIHSDLHGVDNDIFSDFNYDSDA